MIFRNGFDIPAHLVSASHDDLFGDFYQIGDVFSLDGRAESGDYEHVFEWEDVTPVIWQDNGYEVLGCVDFEPTCVVARNGGRTVGFYMDGQAWVDPDHRGNGLGAAMVLSAIAFSGDLPDVRDIGFSEAGYGMHLSALRLLNEHVPVANISAL